MSPARRFVKATGSRSSTCIARAAGAWPAQCIARRRGVRRGASTASRTPRLKACSVAGRRRSISSPASSSRSFRTPSRSRRTSAADAVCSRRSTSSSARSITLGDTVVVQGAGAVGMSTAALARKAGAGQVIVIGAPADRLALAQEMGADHVIDIDGTAPDERLQRVLDLTGGDRRRHRRRSRRFSAGLRRGPADGAQRRRVCDCRSLHEHRRQHHQRARAHQSQAPRHSRMLGQRGRTFPPRASARSNVTAPKCRGRASAPRPTGSGN